MLMMGKQIDLAVEICELGFLWCRLPHVNLHSGKNLRVAPSDVLRLTIDSLQ